jgi:oligopeptide transport system ATP-binding protein
MAKQNWWDESAEITRKHKASGKPLLEVKDLSVSFFTPVGEVKAVSGLSYTLNYGEVMGIVGESGSGKSQEANALLGILQKPGRVTSGYASLQDLSLLDMKEKDLEHIRGDKISMIFQNPMDSLNPVYTIGNQLVDVLKEHNRQVKSRDAWAKALEMLKLVGISNPERRLRQYPHELSGGMRQRVMIAMALICEPQLLIADEPTTALDVTIQAQITNLMKQIQEKTGMAIIFITHNLAVIAEICDTVGVMYGGRMVEAGTVEDIFYKPAHPYTQGLLHSMPRIDEDSGERLVPIEGTPINMLEPNPGCPFAPRCPHCMKICVKENPVQTEVTTSDDAKGFSKSGHRVACWLTAKEKQHG